MSEEIKSPLSTVFDPLTCVRKGLCPVTKLRGKDSAVAPQESHSLYFEQHGSGPEKLLLINGMNSTSFGWQYHVEHLGRSGRYSLLLFDNRGVGNSGTPVGPYSTSAMAEDTIALLDYVGWTADRDLHIVGVSLGGMIAMETASRISNRIISLSLCVTTAGGWVWSNLPPLKGLLGLTRTSFTKEAKDRVPVAVDMIFPGTWLDSKVENDAQNRTNREVQEEEFGRRVAVARAQSPIGVFSQMYAGMTHCVSPARLRDISASVPKVLIVTGDDDNLVDPSNSQYLRSNMPEAEYIQWSTTGHALHLQWPQRFCDMVDSVVTDGREKFEAHKDVWL